MTSGKVRVMRSSESESRPEPSNYSTDDTQTVSSEDESGPAIRGKPTPRAAAINKPAMDLNRVPAELAMQCCGQQATLLARTFLLDRLAGRPGGKVVRMQDGGMVSGSKFAISSGVATKVNWMIKCRLSVNGKNVPVASWEQQYVCRKSSKDDVTLHDPDTAPAELPISFSGKQGTFMAR